MRNCPSCSESVSLWKWDLISGMCLHCRNLQVEADRLGIPLQEHRANEKRRLEQQAARLEEHKAKEKLRLEEHAARLEDYERLRNSTLEANRHAGEQQRQKWLLEAANHYFQEYQDLKHIRFDQEGKPLVGKDAVQWLLTFVQGICCLACVGSIFYPLAASTVSPEWIASLFEVSVGVYLVGAWLTAGCSFAFWVGLLVVVQRAKWVYRMSECQQAILFKLLQLQLEVHNAPTEHN